MFKISRKERKNIEKIFNEKFSGCGIYEIEFVNGENFNSDVDLVFIDIEGDWKHAHAYADNIMESLGYVLDYKKVTNDFNGSDFYAATHGYIKEGAINA